MLTQARLRKLLDYDPETGVFTSRRTAGRWKAGRAVGYRRRGGKTQYIAFNVDGRKYEAHRLAVLWMTGAWPPAEVDHINSNGLDNRWANLRPAGHAENLRNMAIRKDNTSGYIGVHRRYNGRYLAYTRDANGKRIYLGHYDTPEEAAKVHDDAASHHYGEFARLNFS